jgi:enoyl-CoA hydratase/carnithine racemase
MRKQAPTNEKALDTAFLDAAELVRMAADPSERERLSVASGTPAVVVELERGAELPRLGQLSELACVVVGIARQGWEGGDPAVDVLLAEDPAVVDAVVPAEGLESGLRNLLNAIGDRPMASAALAMLLRTTVDSVADGLAFESLVYSLLQAGPEHREALGSLRRPAGVHAPGPAVAVSRYWDALDIALTRPEVHNAFNQVMRDELAEALTLALTDPTIREITLRGEGPSFCSGGDLSEFGTLSDPASAHLIRMTRSPARLMALLRDRVNVRLHGACIGAGIELAAFAGRVTATPDAYVLLPELGFGLVPGAGGTVSIRARIGHRRTAWLALSGAKLDAAAALEWGLVDELVDRESR